MRRFIADLPRPVAIALAAITAALVVFAVLFPLLGGARNDALAKNQRLTSEISSSTSALSQSKSDQEFVHQNQTQFEELLKGSRVIPHTRRAAVVALGEVARAHNVLLSATFAAAAATSTKAVDSQPRSDAYRVSVESIDLKVSAPIDGAIYGFIADIATSFPGSAVVESVTLTRAKEITEGTLRLVSKGQNSKLVEGEVKILWRTAQAQEKK